MLVEPIFRRVLQRVAGRAAGVAVAVIIASAFILVALGFFEAAFYLWLAMYMSPPLAALSTGAVALVIAAATLVASRAFVHKPEATMHGLVERELSEYLGKDVAQKIAKTIASHGIGVALAALLSGMVVGATPRLRRMLRMFLKF